MFNAANHDSKSIANRGQKIDQLLHLETKPTFQPT